MREGDKQADIHADRQTERQADRQTHMQADKQVDRQAGRQTDRQANRQPDSLGVKGYGFSRLFSYQKRSPLRERWNWSARMQANVWPIIAPFT